MGTGSRRRDGESRPRPIYLPVLSLPDFRISHPPQTLEELGVSLQLMDTLQHDLSNLESQIPPIHEQFAILEKYEVPVQDSVSSSGVWSTQGEPMPAAGCMGS